jgi:hypothetical protein
MADRIVTCNLPMESETLQTPFYAFFPHVVNVSTSCEKSNFKPLINFRQTRLQHVSIDIWDSNDICFLTTTTSSAFVPPLSQGLPFSRHYSRVCLSTAATTSSTFVPPLSQGLPFSCHYNRVCLSTAATTSSTFVPPLSQGIPFSRRNNRVCLSTATTTGSARGAKTNRCNHLRKRFNTLQRLCE